MGEQPLTPAEHALWALFWTACANALEHDAVCMMRGQGPFYTTAPRRRCTDPDRRAVLAARATRLAVLSGKLHERADAAIHALFESSELPLKTWVRSWDQPDTMTMGNERPPYLTNYTAFQEWAAKVEGRNWWLACPWCARGASRCPQ